MSCNAKKDPNGTWRIQYRWTDWTGTKKKSQKRGFKTKKEAEEWYAHFMLQQSSDPTMTLADFWEIYKADMEKRLRKTTMKQKEYVMNDKILPYFGKTPINEITAPMIRKWQGEMMEKGFKPTYLKTIHNHLSAILNYAVNFYDLRFNPCRKAGSMGKSKADERPYWTREEFQKFSDAIMDKQDSWIAFQILFWTGMRIGELLALQVKDIDFEQGTITVDESLTRLDGEDLIMAPKTESSVRVITIHKELQEEIKEYIATLYHVRPGTRLFAGRTKSFFEHEMERGIKLSGVKKITVYCTRHSHAKENAYVFDFDPARTLTIFEQFANNLNPNTAKGGGTAEERKENVRELLNFFPVIGEDEQGELVELDAEKVLTIPRKIRSVEVVKRGFMSNFLFQNISNIFGAPKEVIDIITRFEPVDEPKSKFNLTDEVQKDLSLDVNGEGYSRMNMSSAERRMYLEIKSMT